MGLTLLILGRLAVLGVIGTVSYFAARRGVHDEVEGSKLRAVLDRLNSLDDDALAGFLREAREKAGGGE